MDDLGDTSITLDTFGFSFEDHGERIAPIDVKDLWNNTYFGYFCFQLVGNM